jgi:hypothetical protein
MRRKTLIIVAGVLLVLAIAALVFVFIRSRNSTVGQVANTNNTTNNSAQLTNTTDNGTNTNSTNTTGGNTDSGPVLKKILDAKLLGATLNKGNNALIFFNTSANEFYTSATDGSNPQALTTTKFVNVTDVRISPDKTSAILSFDNPNGSVLVKYFYDFSKDLAIKLNENIDNFTFSPDGKKIFYKYTDSLKGANSFNIANANGTDWKSIKDFSLTNVLLDWIPGVNKLAFHLTPSSFRQSAYYVFDQNGENVVAVLDKGYGVDGLWSQSGERLLATFASQHTANLGLVAVNIDGSGNISIPNSRTFIQKCVWMKDNVSVICAVPKSLDPQYFLPDDYNNGNFVTDDQFFRYNTKTGERLQLQLAATKDVASLPAIDASNLFLNSDESILYFENRADKNSLYRINVSAAF